MTIAQALHENSNTHKPVVRKPVIKVTKKK